MAITFSNADSAFTNGGVNPFTSNAVTLPFTDSFGVTMMAGD
jgi:hypothetical protein